LTPERSDRRKVNEKLNENDTKTTRKLDPDTPDNHERHEGDDLAAKLTAGHGIPTESGSCTQVGTRSSSECPAPSHGSPQRRRWARPTEEGVA
jgi:hypothetical protein